MQIANIIDLSQDKLSGITGPAFSSRRYIINNSSQNRNHKYPYPVLPVSGPWFYQIGQIPVLFAPQELDRLDRRVDVTNCKGK